MVASNLIDPLGSGRERKTEIDARHANRKSDEPLRPLDSLNKRDEGTFRAQLKLKV